VPIVRYRGIGKKKKCAVEKKIEFSTPLLLLLLSALLAIIIVVIIIIIIHESWIRMIHITIFGNRRLFRNGPVVCDTEPCAF